MPPAMTRPLFTLFLQRPAPWRALLAVLVIAILWFALSPRPPATVDTGWDKANHAAAFAALAFTAVWALWPRPRQWGWLALWLLAFGGAIEVAQTHLPPRQGDWADLFADGIGMALGLLCAWPLTSRLTRQG